MSTLPSVSIDSCGTLRSICSSVDVADCGSFSTSYVSFSAVCVTNGFCTTISTPSNCSPSSIAMSPMSVALSTFTSIVRVR